jgi:succinate dehydrogenase / fumarate reductase flavoprotein subunit
MSESLRNDGRVWVPKKQGDNRPAVQIPEEDRDYYLERKYPTFGNMVPRDVASRNAKNVCDEGRGVGDTGLAVYLDFAQAIKDFGRDAIAERYGNLFDMYHEITAENAYESPMRIYPAIHYTMGGIWVDYNLMSTIPGLHVIGEANFSDHGANRLGASALMQGLSDGYFVLPYTIGNYLAGAKLDPVSEDHDEFKAVKDEISGKYNKLLNIKGGKTVKEFHKELGQILWDNVGMERSEASLKEALHKIPKLREEFWQNVNVVGEANSFNKNLEMAGRVADYMELGELMAKDALERNESCGGHFRSESQTEEGEALRKDEEFSYVAAWEFKEMGKWKGHKENLKFEFVKPTQRSYK